MLMIQSTLTSSQQRIRSSPKSACANFESNRSLITTLTPSSFQLKAPKAASSAFKLQFEAYPHIHKVVLPFKILLPDHVMEILDRLVWTDISPIDLDEEDTYRAKWYYMYVYAAMRMLSMNAVTESLGNLFRSMTDRWGLATNPRNVVHLPQYLSLDDPVINHLATRYAKRLRMGSLPLSDGPCMEIEGRFPEFAKMVSHTVLSANPETMAKLEDNGMDL